MRIATKSNAGFTTETQRHGCAVDEHLPSALRTKSALIPSPGTPGEGKGGGLLNDASRPNPHPNPPPEYRGREKQIKAPTARWIRYSLFSIQHSAFSIFILLLTITGAFAQVPAPPKPIVPPPRILKDIGIEQKLDAQVPGDLVFKDEQGKDVRLADFYDKRPIVLTLVYYQCPMLCTMVLNDLVRAMRGIGTLDLAKDYDVVTVSFDPSEAPKLAAAKKKQYIAEYGRLSAAHGWHFLTGQQAQITKLAQTVGFHYAWDDHTSTWAHASGIIVLTPTGKVSRYFYGIDYAPSDLKLSLLEAGKGSISPKAADRILLYCFHYDPRSGKYGLVVTRLIQAGGVLTMLLLGGFIGLNLMRERRGSPRRHGDTEAQFKVEGELK